MRALKKQSLRLTDQLQNMKMSYEGASAGDGDKAHQLLSMSARSWTQSAFHAHEAGILSEENLPTISIYKYFDNIYILLPNLALPFSYHNFLQLIVYLSNFMFTYFFLFVGYILTEARSDSQCPAPLRKQSPSMSEAINCGDLHSSILITIF